MMLCMLCELVKGGVQTSGSKIVKTLFWDISWPKRYVKWTNFLTGFWGPRPSGATLAATPIFQAKMPKLQKSIRHMINGAHLIAIIVLSSGIFWNTILDKKWLRYWQKTYAHIWAYGPNLLFYGPHFGQIVLFFNCNNFVQLTMFNYMFIAIFSSKSIKMWILELKNHYFRGFLPFSQYGIFEK